VTGRWNDEYGFLTFADDHGLYTDCDLPWVRPCCSRWRCWRCGYGPSRRGVLATVSLAVAVAGLTVGVFGTAADGSWLTPVGLALLGAGWLGFGWALRRSNRGGLGWLTVALGVFALLGAVDRGLVMLPFVAAGPVWGRILLELVWVPWALVSTLRRRVAPASAG
jgi:hypothetical protein